MPELSAAEFSCVYVTRPTQTLCAHLDVETAKLTAGPSVQKHQAHFPTDSTSLQLSPCCTALMSLVKEVKTAISSLYCSLILSQLKNLALSLIYSQNLHMRLLHCIPFDHGIPLIKWAFQQRPPQFPLSIKQGREDYCMLKKS